MKTIKVCIIGGGHITATYYEAMRHVSALSLVAVVDVDDEKRAGIPDGVCFYHTIEEIPQGTIDVAVVSVPQNQHYTVTMQLFARGIDVLLEKPATETEAELVALVSYAKRSGRLLMFSVHAAHGREVQWFVAQYDVHEKLASLGSIVGFFSGFYDPYVIDGILSASGQSLGGSWRDSGVNALSVLHAIGLHSLEMIERTMVRNITEYEDQATACFQWHDGTDVFRGQIDTNWWAGKNLKITRLYFSGGESVVLHHSNESVIFDSPDGLSEVLADCSNDRPRLVNHYVSIFDELVSRFESRKGNAVTAQSIHHLYFDFYNKPPLSMY